MSLSPQNQTLILREIDVQIENCKDELTSALSISNEKGAEMSRVAEIIANAMVACVKAMALSEMLDELKSL